VGLEYLVNWYYSSCAERVEGSQNGSRKGAEEAETAEQALAEMSKVYDETGRELYMGAGDRKHD
jgi:hypothetical protein